MVNMKSVCFSKSLGRSCSTVFHASQPFTKVLSATKKTGDINEKSVSNERNGVQKWPVRGRPGVFIDHKRSQGAS